MESVIKLNENNKNENGELGNEILSSKNHGQPKKPLADPNILRWRKMNDLSSGKREVKLSNDSGSDSLLNSNNDPQYSKTLKELKAFVEEYDNILEQQSDLKERSKDLFKFLKEKGFKNKALKSSLKDRNFRLYDCDYEEFLDNKKEYDSLLKKVDE